MQLSAKTPVCSARSALSSDEKMIAICNLFDGFASYSLETREKVRHYPVEIHQNVPLPVLFIHEGNYILCGSDCGDVSVFNGVDGSLQQVLRHPGGLSCHFAYLTILRIILRNFLDRGIVQAIVSV